MSAPALPPWNPAWSDGCSIPKALKPFFPETPAVRACCEKHDAVYYRGGTRADRLRADLQLALDWLATGDVTAAQVEQGYWAIRIGGGPEGCFPYSWAFGGQRFVYDED